MKLVSPSTEYESSYVDMICDFELNEERLVPFTLKENYNNFPDLVQRLEGYARGVGALPFEFESTNAE